VSGRRRGGVWGGPVPPPAGPHVGDLRGVSRLVLPLLFRLVAAAAAAAWRGALALAPAQVGGAGVPTGRLVVLRGEFGVGDSSGPARSAPGLMGRLTAEEVHVVHAVSATSCPGGWPVLRSVSSAL